MNLIASLLLAATASNPAAQFVEGIYQRYLKHGKGVPLNTEADLKRVFAPGLVKLIVDDRAKAEKAGDVPALDFDPFVNGQDWNVKSYKVAIEGAQAKVKLLEPKGAATEVTLDLVETPDGWRVADIRYTEGMSLVTLIKKALASTD